MVNRAIGVEGEGEGLRYHPAAPAIAATRTPPLTTIERRTGAFRATFGSAVVASRSRRSFKRNLAVDRSAMRSLRSFSRQPSMSARIAGGMLVGRAFHSGAPRRTAQRLRLAGDSLAGVTRWPLRMAAKAQRALARPLRGWKRYSSTFESPSLRWCETTTRGGAIPSDFLLGVGVVTELSP